MEPPAVSKLAPLGAARYWRCLLPPSESRRSQGRFYIRKQTEIFIEPCAFQDRLDCLLGSGEQENATVKFEALHGADQNSEARAVDIRNAGKIDYQSLRFRIDDLSK